MSGPQVRRLFKTSVEVQAADALRESIVGGTIPPGSRITEIQISEQMNVSRATLRAALHQLANEGLVVLVPYTGWTVMSLSERDVWELYTLRSSIERLAGQLVARSIDAARAHKLRRGFEALIKECRGGNRSRIAEADFALHKSIIQMADHTRLAAQYGLLEQQVRIYIRSSDALITEPETIIEQHRPIVDAIIAGEVERAGRLSEAHNLSEGEKLSAHLRDPAARAEGHPQVVGGRRRQTAG